MPDLQGLHRVEDDLAYMDGLETVKVLQAGSSPGSKKIEVCKRRQISVREATASGGKYTQEDTTFRMPSSPFTDWTPEVGGFVVTTDSPAETWTILARDDFKVRRVYRLVCRRSYLPTDAGSGSDQLSLLKPTWGKDADLSPVAAFALHTQVVGFMEEIDMSLVVEHAARRVKATHRASFADVPDLEPGWRIQLAQENFTVLRVSGRNELGGFVVCDLEAVRNPEGM